MGLELPTEKSKPKTKLNELMFYFYGLPKIGKTSLALQFPDALLLACEPGAKTHECFQVPIKNWTDLRDIRTELKKKKEFATVIIDTADLAFAYCDKYVCTRLGVEDRADAGWGKGWNAVKREFTDVVLSISHTGRGIVFTSHQSMEPYKDHNGKDRQRIIPSLRDKGAFIMNSIVDVWAPILYENGSRVLRMRGNEHIEAGQRLSPKAFPHVAALDEIPLGKSAEEAYAALFAALFPGQAKQEVK